MFKKGTGEYKLPVYNNRRKSDYNSHFPPIIINSIVYCASSTAACAAAKNAFLSVTYIISSDN